MADLIWSGVLVVASVAGIAVVVAVVGLLIALMATSEWDGKDE